MSNRVTIKIVNSQLDSIKGMLEEQGNPQPELEITNLYGTAYALVEMRTNGGYYKVFGGTLREISDHLQGWQTCLYRLSRSFKEWKSNQ